MKKNYILLTATIAAVGLLSFRNDANVQVSNYHKVDKMSSNGTQTGRTGAPDETNCACVAP